MHKFAALNCLFCNFLKKNFSVHTNGRLVLHIKSTQYSRFIFLVKIDFVVPEKQFQTLQLLNRVWDSCLLIIFWWSISCNNLIWSFKLLPQLLNFPLKRLFCLIKRVYGVNFGQRITIFGPSSRFQRHYLIFEYFVFLLSFLFQYLQRFCFFSQFEQLLGLFLCKYFQFSVFLYQSFGHFLVDWLKFFRGCATLPAKFFQNLIFEEVSSRGHKTTCHVNSSSPFAFLLLTITSVLNFVFVWSKSSVFFS